MADRPLHSGYSACYIHSGKYTPPATFRILCYTQANTLRPLHSGTRTHIIPARPATSQPKPVAHHSVLVGDCVVGVRVREGKGRDVQQGDVEHEEVVPACNQRTYGTADQAEPTFGCNESLMVNLQQPLPSRFLPQS